MLVEALFDQRKKVFLALSQITLIILKFMFHLAFRERALIRTHGALHPLALDAALICFYVNFYQRPIVIGYVSTKRLLYCYIARKAPLKLPILVLRHFLLVFVPRLFQFLEAGSDV